MNIKELREIINSYSSDDVIENKIIKSLSRDDNVLQDMLKILEEERKFKNEINKEMNFLLSLADTGLDNKKYNHENHIQAKIKDFYLKYKDFRAYVGHIYKNIY
jgi:DNA-binding transcriptional MerR regulator